MPLRMTPERYAERREQVVQKLTQNMRELFTDAHARHSISQRMYPNLSRPQPEADQSKGPVQGWAHLRNQQERK
jgi:hypothetical protein